MESFLEEKVIYKESRIYKFRQIFMCLTCSLQAFCNGCIFGMTSILLPQLQESQEIVLDKDQESWIASISTLALIPTVLFTGPIIDKFGRRKALMYIFTLTATTWITIYSSNSFPTLMVGRALGGAFIGQGYPIILAYMGEVTDPAIRAVCLTGGPLGTACGVLAIQLLGIYLHWKTICLILLALPIYNFSVCILYIKESYIWYINKGYEDEARKAFFWYRGKSPKAQAEFREAFENSTMNYNSSLKEKLSYFFSKKVVYPFSLTCLLYLTSEFSGDIAIIFYTSQIVKIVTNDESIQYYSTLVLNTLRVVATASSCVLLRKFSIRKVWIGSGYCLAVSLFNISLFLYLSNAYPENRAFPLVCIVSIVVNVIFFASGAGPLPSVICGELYPAPVRGVGSAISTFICFISVFSIVKMMPYLFEYVATPVIFLIFALCTFSGVTISCFVLPNTKNRTLKDLETFYEK